MDILEVIKQETTDTPIILYMKGEKDMPMCRFSMQAVQMIKQYTDDFETRNVLEDDDLRQGIKDFSDWPTIPQLYVKGEFIGGADIIAELDESGELEALLTS